MKKIIFGGLLFALPMFVFAQNLGSFNTFLANVGKLVANATPIVFGLSLLFFFWGLARFILAAGDADAQKEGKNIMIWGVVALFVMASVWGLVGFLQDNLGIDNDDDITVPRVLR